MRALRFDANSRCLILTAREPEPAPEPGEALIRLRLAGICQTDLELTRGYMGFSGILGHEFVGELVTDAGPYRAGQRVCGEINIACGECTLCRAGVPSQCLNNRRTLGIFDYPGVFADLLRLPIVNLHPVPDNVPDEMAVFTEPLAAAFEVTAQARISPADRVVLIGAGKLGLLVAQVLKLTGCDLVAVARQPRAINLLTQWGIPWVDARQPDWIERIGRRSAHVVVECTGNEAGFSQALELVRPRGAIVLKSTYADLPRADLTRVVVDEITLVGSRCGPFAAALRALAARLVDTTPMIEARYPLDEAEQAFEFAAQPGVLKVLLSPG